MVVEKKHIELDGENTNISWEETAIRSGVINGDVDWTIDLGVFASGNDTYRFRIVDYSNGETLCPDSSYQPDSDCGIQFNVSIDILEPNLLGVQLYKRYAGEGDPNLMRIGEIFTMKVGQNLEFPRTLGLSQMTFQYLQQPLQCMYGLNMTTMQILME